MPSVREIAKARCLLWAVSAIAFVACVGLAYTAHSVATDIHVMRMEHHYLARACRAAQPMATDPNVLKELPEFVVWYSQSCGG